MNYFVVVSSFNYSFLHIFYLDWITLAAAFIAGIIWGIIYQCIPNYYGVAASHAAIGAVSIAVGLI